MKNIHVEITNTDGEVVNDYYVHRLSVRDNIERVEMHRKISEMDVSDEIRGHLYTCSSLSVALRDEEGDRIFSSLEDLEDNLDYEEYGLLIKHYLELNPLEASLDAKKKKS